MKTMRTLKTVASIGMVLIASGALAVNAGDLEPPGPPAPTMKTLVEVEPRQTISDADMPLTIFQPGSYYLTENLLATGFGDDAITIETSGVTIDLNGFSIAGSEVGVWDYGILVSGEIENIVVKNGTVRDCAEDGVALDPGAGFSNASNCRVEGVQAVSNAGDGIRVYENSLIVNSVAQNNGGDGFRLNGARIENSTAWDNGNSGITAVNRSVVDRCTVNGNSGVGVFVSVSTVKNSTSNGNQNGIRAGTGKSSIVGNEVHSNTFDGIHVQAGATDTVRVDGNDVTNNGANGINVDGTGHIIIRNLAADNVTADYDIVAGNAVGLILNVAGAAITTSNPWRNLEY